MKKQNNHDLMNSLETAAIQSNKRPVFISILCIITWAGCAIALGASIFHYSVTSIRCSQMDSSGSGSGLDNLVHLFMGKTCETIGITTILRILSIAACFLGSLWMWKLRKKGFYLYVAGEVIPVLMSLVLGVSGVFTLDNLVSGGMIAAIWVTLYAFNLKHMR